MPYPYLAGYLRAKLDLYGTADDDWQALERAGEQAEKDRVFLAAQTERWLDWEQRLELLAADIRAADRRPPLLYSVELAVERIAPPSGDQPELAYLNITGSAYDASGVSRVTANGEPLRLERDERGPDWSRFASTIAVVAPDLHHEIEIVASDHACKRDTTGGPCRNNVAEPRREPLPLPIWRGRAGEVGQEIHGVIVGIDSYGPLPKLKAAVRDARRFQDLLLRYGVPAGNLELLVSPEETTGERIRTAVERLADKAGRQAIFYFAGHGMGSNEDTNVLLPSDIDAIELAPTPAGSPPRERKALGVKEIETILERAAFRERFMIIDACRSPLSSSPRGAEDLGTAHTFEFDVTDAGRGLILEQPPRKDQHAEKGAVLFWGSGPREPSREMPDETAGYFTWYFIEGLRLGKSLDALASYVHDKVRDRTQSDLGNHNEQRPAVRWTPSLREDQTRRREQYLLPPANHERVTGTQAR